jgi:NhaA family Na+:H+ antiporter
MARAALVPSESTDIQRRLLAPLERFLHIEAASGVLLLLAAAAALLWANSPWAAGYAALWHTPVQLRIGSWALAEPLHFWINEGLMTIFFLVVGLEIRREIHEGTLSRFENAMLPVAAALGGVVVPAVIYLLFVTGDARDGWAIPTATDIAFAVGVLALLGSRVPAGLRVVLLAIAIIDDLAAVLIIAVAYSGGVGVAGMGIAMAGIAGVLVFQKLKVRSAWLYVLPGSVLWAGLLHAGLHPTLAGVVLGLMTPVRRSHAEGLLQEATRALGELDKRRWASALDVKAASHQVNAIRRANRDILPPVVRVEMSLHGWVAFGVIPLFALANAGVNIGDIAWSEPGITAVMAACAVALVFGKLLGVLTGAFVATRIGICALPPAVTWRGMTLVGTLAGIGFTMAIFIADLAFQGQLLEAAKAGVLVASAVAGVAAIVAGRWLLPERKPPAPHVQLPPSPQ